MRMRVLVLMFGVGVGVGSGERVEQPLAVLELLVLQGVPACLGERAEPELDCVFLRGLVVLLGLPLRLAFAFALIFVRYGGPAGVPGPVGGEARGVRCGGESDKCEAFAFGWRAGGVGVVWGEGYRLYGAWKVRTCTCAGGRRGRGGNGKQGREEAVDPRGGAVREGHVFLRVMEVLV